MIIKRRSIKIDDDLKDIIPDEVTLIKHDNVISVVKPTGSRKNRMSVMRYKKGVHIRTPSDLFPYIGHQVIFQVNKINPLLDELFIIVPVDFQFGITKSQVKFPYFTMGGRLIIPNSYMFRYHSDGISRVKVSNFEDIVYIKFDKDQINTYLLNPYKNGFQTKVIDKHFANYSYIKTTSDNIMIFKEDYA